MQANSLRLRGLRTAFLFGPPRLIERSEATILYTAVCDAMGQDDLGYRYKPLGEAEKPGSKGMLITFDRKEGQGQFSVSIEMPSVNMPIRLLFVYDHPPSLEHAAEQFDMGYDGVFKSLKGQWTRVLAEVRLTAQCNTRENNGLEFVTRKFLNLDQAWLTELGDPLMSSSVKFLVGAGSPASEDQLDQPARELQIEVLNEDPRCVYLELMQQWPQLPAIPLAPQQALGVRSIRRIDERPSAYIRNAYEYLGDRVKSLDKKGMA